MKRERIRPGRPFLLLLFFLCVRGIEAQQTRIFQLADFSGALAAMYQSTNERWGAQEFTTLDLGRKLLQGGINLNTSGSIYHPNLLSFRADINLFGLSSKRRMFLDTTSNNDLNNSYDVSLAFLQKKPLHLELYIKRSFSSADRAFMERYYTTVESTGFRVISRARFVPFHLEASQSRRLSESEVFTERLERSKNVDLKATLLELERARSHLTMRWKDYQEAVYTIDYRSFDVMTNFMLNYGAVNPNRFLTLLSYNRMEGDYDIRRLQFRANQTHYFWSDLFLTPGYSFIQDNSFGRSIRKHLVQGTINHKLYQSLTSSFQVGGRFEKSLFQDINGWHNRIQFDYRKKIPSGSLLLGFARRGESTDFVSQGGVGQASRPHDFSQSDTILLTRPGIDLTSIRLMDAEIPYVYLEGVDYLLDTVQGQVAIIRLPGGMISTRTKVLVVYEYMSYPDYHLQGRFYQLLFRLSFLRYFQAFYIRGSNLQDITSEFLIPPYENYDRDTYGAKLTSQLVSAEFSQEKYRSSLTDYDSRNIRITGQARLLSVLKLMASFSLQKLDYIPAGFSSFYRAVSVESTYNPRANITARAIFRNIRYSTNTYFLDRTSLLFKFQWAFRSVIFNFFYEHILIGYENSDKLRDYFSFVIRRTF